MQGAQNFQRLFGYVHAGIHQRRLVRAQLTVGAARRAVPGCGNHALVAFDFSVPDFNPVAERAARRAQRRALAASLGMTEAQVAALAAEVRERERAEKRSRLVAERAARLAEQLRRLGVDPDKL